MATEYPNPLSRAFLQEVVEQRPDEMAIRKNYIGSTLLPFEDVDEYQLTWDTVKAENGLAGIYAIRGRPVPGSDRLFEQMFARVQHVMATRIVDPYSVMVLRDPGMVGVRSRAESSARERSLRKIRESIEWCDDRIDTTIEYMIMNTLQGSITWPPTDADGAAITEVAPEWGEASFTMTFPLRSTFNQAATTLVGYDSRAGAQVAWNDTSASPIKDLEVIAELIWRTTGLPARGSTIICSASVLSYLAFNTEFVNRITGTESGIRFLDIGALKEFIATNLGFKFLEYDAMWTYRTSVGSDAGPTISSVPFLPAGRCIILPPGEDFGTFATAPAPGQDDAFDTGKYVWVAKDEEPPFETRLGEGIIGFPMPKRIDSVFVFDAWS